MNTFSKMWNIQTPAQAKAKIAEQIADLGITEPKNLEEQALSLVGTDVYEKLIKGYTEKQWGRSCRGTAFPLSSGVFRFVVLLMIIIISTPAIRAFRLKATQPL